MKQVAIAFSTKDRVELSQQSIIPLLQPEKFDLFWIDGSTTLEGIALPPEYRAFNIDSGIRGGADAAIVFALTKMLQHGYEFVGLVENDVLLADDWLEPTLELFEKGEREGLKVGAVSARCYEDRILIQRDGYALMHNLGAGHVIFSREAADIILQNYRTGHTWENRRVFAQLSLLDPARWCAFLRDPHATTVDWQFDRILAQYGLASLALTPAKATMIGQEKSLEEQGLILAAGPVNARLNDPLFEHFCSMQKELRAGHFKIPSSPFLLQDDGSMMIMPHQFPMVGGHFENDWALRWLQAFGPFGYRGRENSALAVRLSGPVAFLLAGGETGGRVRLQDFDSGFDVNVKIEPEGPNGQVLQVQVPAGVSYRAIAMTVLEGEVILVGVAVREQQPIYSGVRFDYGTLPAVDFPPLTET